MSEASVKERVHGTGNPPFGRRMQMDRIFQKLDNQMFPPPPILDSIEIPLLASIPRLTQRARRVISVQKNRYQRHRSKTSRQVCVLFQRKTHSVAPICNFRTDSHVTRDSISRHVFLSRVIYVYTR